MIMSAKIGIIVTEVISMNREATIALPVAIVKKMSKAVQAIEEFTDEFEDYLMVSDKHFIAKMHKARKEHLSGQTKPFSELKKKYV